MTTQLLSPWNLMTFCKCSYSANFLHPCQAHFVNTGPSAACEFPASSYDFTQSISQHPEKKLMFSSVFSFTLANLLTLIEYLLPSNLYASNLTTILSNLLLFEAYWLFTCSAHWITSVLLSLQSKNKHFCTCLARSTNFRVFIVSSMLLADGEMFPTMKV